MHVERRIIRRNRFVENLLELVGKCIYRKDDVPLSRQSRSIRRRLGVKKERKAMREKRETRTASTCRNGARRGEAADKVRDCPVTFRTSFRPIVDIFPRIFFFPTRSQSVSLSFPLRSAFPLKAEPEVGSPGGSRAMTKQLEDQSVPRIRSIYRIISKWFYGIT